MRGKSASARDSRSAVHLSAEDSLAELSVLAASAGAVVAAQVLQVRGAPDAATLIGSGKVTELEGLIRLHSATLAIFDIELSPTQLRNLERYLDCRVIDRTQLILDIFARRARTREGQLQVELAQLNYLLPRLAGRGTAMSRLGGGIGTRGPGETQLETDRRKISRRIKTLEQNLESVRGGRRIQRRQRQSVPLATVALAGYTNAGKSTLFNRLTGAQVTADSRMFATLDPTVRHITLPSRRRVLLSDTVGFIRNLPTTLVKAFRATLEEVVEAKLILHVLDASSPDAAEQTAHVQKVLVEIGVAETPQLLVLNKIDLLPGDQPPEVVAQEILAETSDLVPKRLAGVSARTGAGIDKLLRAIDDLLPLDPVARARFSIPAGDGASLSLIHASAEVLAVQYESDVYTVEAMAPASLRQRLKAFLI